MLVVWIYLVIINIVAFIVMGIDKKRAKKGLYRISELTLWVQALMGGAIGSTVAMYFFRHKTRHLNFKIGFPFIVIMQITILAQVL